MATVKRTLAGRYRLGAVIGRGAMGTVYAGVDLVLKRPVAVKLISDVLAAQDPVSVARFEREAKAAAALAHPAVVTVYDAGVDEGSPFIVMERLDGQDLAAVLRERAPLPAHEAARIAAQIASALAAAHAAGMIHRDIKPANVMLTVEHAVKVLDFGIARAGDATTLTQAARAAGTAAYMAPELAMGELAEERSDIYSLGCVLYAMLSGAPPFTGQADAAILHQHVHARPRALRSIDARIPPELADLVEEMLAKAPEARPQDASDLAERLQAISKRATPARSVTDGARTRIHDPVAAMPTVAHPAAHARRTRIAAATALLAAVFAATLIALGLLGAPRPSRASASTHRHGSGAPTNRVHASGSSEAGAQTGSRSHSPSTQGAGPAQAARQGSAVADSTGREGTGPEGTQESSYEDKKPNEGAGKDGGKDGGGDQPSESPLQGAPPPGHGGQPPGLGGKPPGHDGHQPPGHGGTPPGQD